MADEEASEVIIMCGSQSYFPDDVHGECDHCGDDIVWRPHNPPGTHLCIECSMESMDQDAIGAMDLDVTDETLQEVQEVLKKRTS